MALIQCPSCGQMISEQAPMCPHCGHPIANVNYYNSPQPQPQAQPKSGNNSKVIVGVLAAIIATLAIILLVVIGKGCAKGNSDIVSSSSSSETTSYENAATDTAATDTVAAPDILTAANDAPDESLVQEEEYEEQEYIAPDDEFIVASYKGNGLFLRYAPRSGATTKTTYPDGTHFLGAYSDTPGWVMVLEDGQCIGYFPQNKLIVAGDYETERYYDLN